MLFYTSGTKFHKELTKRLMSDARKLLPNEKIFQLEAQHHFDSLHQHSSTFNMHEGKRRKNRHQILFSV